MKKTFMALSMIALFGCNGGDENQTASSEAEAVGNEFSDLMGSDHEKTEQACSSNQFSCSIEDGNPIFTNQSGEISINPKQSMLTLNTTNLGFSNTSDHKLAKASIVSRGEEYPIDVENHVLDHNGESLKSIVIASLDESLSDHITSGDVKLRVEVAYNNALRDDLAEANTKAFTIELFDEGEHSQFVSSIVSDNIINCETDPESAVCNIDTEKPVLESIPTLFAASGEEFKHQVNATDNSDFVLFALKDEPEWLSISSKGLITAKAPAELEGTFNFTAVVSDGKFTVEQKNIQIIVSDETPSDPEDGEPAPTPPVVQDINQLAIAAGQATYYQVDAVSEDKVLAYFLTDSPEWVTVNSNGRLRIAPPEEAPQGVHTALLTVANETFNVTIEVEIQVYPMPTADCGLNSNDPECEGLDDSFVTPQVAPVINAIPEMIAYDGSRYTYQVEAFDPNEDDKITYFLNDAPEFVHITSSGVINVNAPFGTKGEFDFMVIASDGNYFTEGAAKLTVNESGFNACEEGSTDPECANIDDGFTNPHDQSIPMIEPIESVEMLVGGSATRKIVAKLKSGVSYALHDSPDWASIGGNTIHLHPEESGVFTVTVKSYNGIFYSLQSFEVVVKGLESEVPNEAPVVQDVPKLETSVYTEVTHQIIATDKESKGLGYSVVGAPEFVSIDKNGLLTVTPHVVVEHEGLHTFDVAVTDGVATTTTKVSVDVDPYSHYGRDADNDGIDDGVELEHGLNPEDPSDAFADNDGDGLTNFEELVTRGVVENYHASNHGGMLDQGDWSVWTSNGLENEKHSTDFVESETGNYSQVHDSDGTSRVHFHMKHDIDWAVESPKLYKDGGTFKFNGSLHGSGGIISMFMLPAQAEDSLRKPLFIVADKLGDGLRVTLNDSLTLVAEDVYVDGKTRFDIDIEFHGNNSYGGTIYVNGKELHTSDNLFTAKRTYSYGMFLGTEGSNTRGWNVHSLTLLTGVKDITNPNLADTDGDGISDKDEILGGLDPNNPLDGLNVDSDGDGVDNSVEIENGLDPFNPNDQIGVDTDGDGIYNEDEIEVGMDPFSPDDMNADPDGDGLTTGEELANGLNPTDPNDGATADSDGDGVTNGDEIVDGTNPNDHMLMVKDHFTAELLVDDTNADGLVNDNDDRLSVTFDRYSLRKDDIEYHHFDEDAVEQFKAFRDLPETRSFRGRIDGMPDTAVLATIWEDCSISYDVFYGYSAKPGFRPSADAPFAQLNRVIFDHEGICKTEGVSDSRYQQGLKADLTNIPYVEPVTEDWENYFPSKEEFHLYERPQGHQASYKIFADHNKGSEVDTIATMEHHLNAGDYSLSRSMQERVTMTDILIEKSGFGAPDDGSTSAQWAGNWGYTLSKFWNPRQLTESGYWWENVLWNFPRGAGGFAYGVRLQTQPHHRSYIHEMGHHLGSKHYNFSERWGGTNTMTGAGLQNASSLVHQNMATMRRNKNVGHTNQFTDLRVPAADWGIHPFAQPDHTSIYRNGTGTINVLKNDSDANNDDITVQSAHIIESGSTSGAIDTVLTVLDDGQIHIEPPKGFIGLIEAFYVLSDSTGLTSRGMLHINVEQNGISDVMTFDGQGYDDTQGLVTTDGRISYGYLFSETPKLSKLMVANWDYAGRSRDESGVHIQVPYATYNALTGKSGLEGDKAPTWVAKQYPISSNQMNKDEKISPHEFHPHLYEINDKDFSVSFWYKPNKDIDLNLLTELARRGRDQDNDFDGDGWVIGAQGTTLKLDLHDKNLHSKNRILKLNVPDIPQLLDTETWVQVGMTLSWDQRIAKLFVDGEKVGEVVIPDNFSYISTSGTSAWIAYGAHASFGQQPAQSGQVGFISATNHGGFDDLVIAHSAFSEEKMRDVYNNRIPAFDPSVVNGSNVDMALVSSLGWNTHVTQQSDVTGYKVYLSDAENMTESDLFVETTETSIDVSEYGFDSTNAYYWKVDTLLSDGTVIGGEVWSFWQAKEVSLYRSDEKVVHSTIVDEEPYVCNGYHEEEYVGQAL
ncbi:Ig-like domain-containing protein [Vibrio renipiscarius]|uniref:Ig-like domain-containing protein n=1 Tax=Vibrio renipiscarius TaxID=1461322 RepID=UPI0035505853